MMGKINLDKIKNFDPIRPENKTEVKSGQNVPVRPESSGATKQDRVNFSTKAAEAGKLVDEIKALPDVRTEEIAQIRSAVEAGKFDPSGDEIATAILKDEGSL